METKAAPSSSPVTVLICRAAIYGQMYCVLLFRVLLCFCPSLPFPQKSGEMLFTGFPWVLRIPAKKYKTLERGNRLLSYQMLQTLQS